MAAKSSANENKVFAMSVTKPSIKLGKNGRGAEKVHRSGRGGVFSAKMAISPTTNSLFSLNAVYWREVKRWNVNWNIKSLIALTAAKSSPRTFSAVTQQESL